MGLLVGLPVHGCHQSVFPQVANPVVHFLTPGWFDSLRGCVPCLLTRRTMYYLFWLLGFILFFGCVLTVRFIFWGTEYPAPVAMEFLGYFKATIFHFSFLSFSRLTPLNLKSGCIWDVLFLRKYTIKNRMIFSFTCRSIFKQVSKTQKQLL